MRGAEEAGRQAIGAVCGQGVMRGAKRHPAPAFDHFVMAITSGVQSLR
jgi:hypothetical protein